jgi:hypothetical protein
MLTCCVCKDQKPKCMFHKNSKTKRGYDSRCISCKKVKRDAERQTNEYREWDAVRHAIWVLENPEKHALCVNRRRTSEDEQIASWTRNNKEELKAIAAIYKEAKILSEAYSFTFHVDHIVPLNSPFVSGLTCLANLEPLSAEANISKGNRWWPDMQENLCLDNIMRDSELAVAKKNLETSQVQ